MKQEKNKKVRKKTDGKKHKIKLNWIFTVAVIAVFVVTMIIIGIVVYSLMGLGVIHVEAGELSGYYLILVILITSIILGALISAFVSKFLFKTIDTVINGMNKLSLGDFKVRLNVGRLKETKRLVNAFNLLADELDNTKVLRSDFVNEFAHEFKTPIVSIKGFAELLRDEGVSEEQKKEYLDVIIEETDRLSTLSVNALNMSKVEKQSILTGTSTFNVSEQIRGSLLLLEKKWTAKNLDLNVDFAEYEITANEELLKQVWINLLDNAIKFSRKNGQLEIELDVIEDIINVKITNHGDVIPPEEQKKIFDKFYRSDSSHTLEGSGIGLAIVKKIVSLHNGNISVESSEGATTFIVSLPEAKKIE